nr:thiamine pyrophosphate-dependent enzyme [Bacillus subtilis]
MPHAVGIALAGRMEKKDIAAFVTFGEGSSNQGDFHEGANFAAVHKLLRLFSCVKTTNTQSQCLTISKSHVRTFPTVP